MRRDAPAASTSAEIPELLCFWITLCGSSFSTGEILFNFCFWGLFPFSGNVQRNPGVPACNSGMFAAISLVLAKPRKHPLLKLIMSNAPGAGMPGPWHEP